MSPCAPPPRSRLFRIVRVTLEDPNRAHRLTGWLVIEENGVRLRLNIVDTPGYGDQVNNDRWYDIRPLLCAKQKDEPRLMTCPAGTPLSSTSRINTRPTSARNSLLSVSVTSKIRVFTAACSSSSPLAMREFFFPSNLFPSTPH